MEYNSKLSVLEANHASIQNFSFLVSPSVRIILQAHLVSPGDRIILQAHLVPVDRIILQAHLVSPSDRIILQAHFVSPSDCKLYYKPTLGSEAQRVGLLMKKR